MKTFILRQKSDNTEDDKFFYWVKTTMQGIELITPFRDKATKVKEDESIYVVSKNWEFIKVN